MLLLLDEYTKNGKNKFTVNYLGGEPTLWNKLPDLLRCIKEKHSIFSSITTNASRKINWWKENADVFDKVFISVHREFSNIEHIIEVADLLYEKNIVCAVNVMMDHKDFDKCVDMVENLKHSKHKWPIQAKLVHLDGIVNYTEMQKKYIEDNPKRWPNWFWFFKNRKEAVLKRKTKIKSNNRWKTVPNNYFMLNGINHFKGWECNLGIDHLYIDKNGNLTGTCGHKIWNNNEYYNLYDNHLYKKIKMELSPVICKNNDCLCQAEVCLAKKQLQSNQNLPVTLL
jgi:organic radical activating enzyme